MKQCPGMAAALALVGGVWGGSTAFGQTAPTATTAAAVPLTAPLEFTAIDKPSDDGSALMLTWKTMPYERPDVLYELWMADRPEGPFWSQGKMTSKPPPEGGKVSYPVCTLQANYPASFGFGRATHQYHAVEVSKFVREEGGKKVSKGLERDKPYSFRLDVIRDGEVLEGTEVVSATPADNWFAAHKLNVLIAMLVLSTIIMAAAKIAKMNPQRLFIRRIGGLEAVEDALGRAAEMGKPVFFCHGPGDLAEVVTLSAINLLGKISERVAEYGTEMKVTCLSYYVMQVSQEMVKDAYIRAGRPDAYKDENVFYVSDNTFAYSAAVGGMMIREKAGTAFFFGRFGSESLLLSETGAITKAIQIAGTDSFTQIPFFITTCDYTLIAEEMYAASAYLSREPRLVGAVKGQDVIKALTMTAIVVGASLASLGSMWFARLFWALTN
jgi:hypothetical protein